MEEVYHILFELRLQHLNQKSKDSGNNLLTGGTVLICDETSMSRNQWRLGKVNEVVVGKDGKIQGSKVIIVPKSGTRSTCYRPVQKLIQFEIDYKLRETDGDKDVDNERDEIKDDEVMADIVDKSDIKSTRKAAIKRQYIRKLRDKYGLQVNEGRMLKLKERRNQNQIPFQLYYLGT